YKGANALLFGLENVFVIYFGAHLVLDNSFSTGMLIAYMAYKTTFTTRVGGLVDKFFEVRMLELQASRLADIVFHEREDPGPPIGATAPDVEARIELRNVSYRYADSEPNVLQDCSLTIDAGD